MSKTLGVFLSRLAPLHLGHQRIIDKLISDFGLKNTLVLIGSSQSYNSKTPYTFARRKMMVRKIYPGIKAVAFPDVNPEKENFEKATLDAWIKNLKNLEKAMKAEFTFYGGSAKDINYLRKDFKIHVPVNRNASKSIISATRIRNAIKYKDYKLLSKMLNKKIIPLAIEGYNKFLKLDSEIIK